MRSPFTERALEQLRNSRPTKDSWVGDPTLPRFGLRLKPASSEASRPALSWAIRYSVNGVKRRYHVADARSTDYNDKLRKRVSELLHKIDDGTDIANERVAERGRITFAAAWELYLKSQKFAECRPRSQGSIRDHGRLHLLPELGAKALADIGPNDARALVAKFSTVRKIKDKWGKLVQRGGPVTARKAFSTLSAFMGWAADVSGLIERNPLYRAVKLRADRRREQMWSSEEYQRFFAALDALAGFGPDKVRPVVADAIRLIAFSGMRRGEVQNLVWSQVRLRESKIILAANAHKAGSKTNKMRVIDLDPLAVEVIKRQPKHEDVERVFPGTGGAKLTINTEFRRARDAAELSSSYVPHGLRHSLATHAAMKKATVPELMQLLGHSSPAMAMRYVKLASDLGAGVATRAVDSIMGRVDKAHESQA